MKHFLLVLTLAALAACADITAPPVHALLEQSGWTTGPCWLSLDHVLPLHDDAGHPTGEVVTLVETNYFDSCPAEDAVHPGWYRTYAPK